jgi:baseplate J-like protein
VSDANDCACCAGIGAETPKAKSNPPGLPAIAYRVGAQPTFKASLLARLSSTDFPGLAPLTSRSKDDWTVALCDAFACMADVLTFYQERLANESYLRTAAERRSVLELARLIGYKLAPGVAAGTALAFTLEPAPGQPALAAQPVTVPSGTRVQSVPDPNQDPQTFETVAPIDARVEWNAIPARTGQAISIAQGQKEIHLVGTASQLQQGDAILIVGRERLQDPESNRWDVRWLDRVELDAARDVTHLHWDKPLGSQWGSSPPSALGVHMYAFRQRATLFGANAMDPALLQIPNYTPDKTGSDWTNHSVDQTAKRIDLDAGYPKITVGSWVSLAGGTGGLLPVGYVELYQVMGVTQASVAAYAMSGKVTRLIVDTGVHLDLFRLRDTFAVAQTEQLAVALRPLRYPVFGGTLDLGVRAPDLAPGQLLAVTGKRQRVALPRDVAGISFPADAGRKPLPDEEFLMLAATEVQIGTDEWQALDPEDLDPAEYDPLHPPAEVWRWTLLDRDGATVKVVAPATALVLQPSLKNDEVLSEVVAIAAGAAGVSSDLDSTTLILAGPLANCYERSSVAVNANVAPATHGQTVTEIAGSGDASQPNQSFQLKQSPLTYVSSASDPSGAEATLQVRVNDLLWEERPSLYGTGARDRVYSLRQDNDARTTIEFGDGEQGARLPSAQNNVRLAYRKGIGAAGNLRADQLTQLLTRPLGVKRATNASPATGGQDPEQLDKARRNAPLRVLTLDRAVSISDYADFSRAFAGVAKAYAIWMNDGRARGIYVTVAGEGGDPIPQGSDTQLNLIGALRKYGDPLLPLSVQTFANATFTLKATVKISSDADPDRTLARVEAALRDAYSFDARDFGQPVTIDEIYAVIQDVDGVVASDIQQLYRKDTGAVAPQPQPRLAAALSAVQDDGTVSPAELLTLDPAPFELGTMP